MSDHAMKVLIFTEGTLIMHKNAVGHTREEIVKQVRDGEDSSLFEWKTYIPIGCAVEKLQTWKSQDVEILFLTSRMKFTEIEDIKSVLEKHDFPHGELLFRQEGEEYKDVMERAMPDIIIEDDCESIGGKDEMTYTHLKPALKKKVKSIVVKEFGGINHLPDSISALSQTEEK
jgi:hypothetical protein